MCGDNTHVGNKTRGSKKRKQINVIIDRPETPEEIKSVHEILVNARTEMAISQIKRKFKDPSDRKELYEFLMSL